MSVVAPLLEAKRMSLGLTAKKAAPAETPNTMLTALALFTRFQQR